jgi:hypothetical protein
MHTHFLNTILAVMQLSQVLEAAVRRVNLLKLRSQLDTQSIAYRDVDGTLLFRVPCEPLVTRELRLRLEDYGRTVAGAGLAAWSVTMALTNVVRIFTAFHAAFCMPCFQ